MVEGRLDVAGAEVEEGDALERAGPHRIESQRVGPRVEGAGEIALVAQDPGHEIVRVGEARIPVQPAARDLVGRLELAPAPQRFAQLQKGETRRLVGQPLRSGCGCRQSR